MTCASQQDQGGNKLFYAVSGAPQHDRQPHPETAKRVPAILAALERTGVTAPALADKVPMLERIQAAWTWLKTAICAVDNDTRV